MNLSLVQLFTLFSTCTVIIILEIFKDSITCNFFDDLFLQVSETDLYLLGAIEKLVYRMDLMDQRLRRAEELVQHVLEGSNIKRQGE